MASTDIADAARVTFRMKNTTSSEELQFGVSTGPRDAETRITLVDALEDWWVSFVAPKAPHSDLFQIVYSDWGTGGFVGFHQAYQQLVSHAGSSAAPMPPQIAVVGSLLNTTDSDVGLKSRRGRIYFPPPLDASDDANGRLFSTDRNGYVTALQQLHDALQSVGSALTTYSGICLASPRTGLLLTIDQIGVGLAYDTHRSRRQKAQESIAYTTLT